MGPCCDRKRILVVDDDVDSAEMLQEFLEATGHEVSVAHDAHGTLVRAAAFRPAVILLDIHMRGTTGFEICRLLGSLTDLQPRIIALTGDARIDEDELRAIGVSDVLLKPLDLPRLLGLLAPPLLPAEG